MIRDLLDDDGENRAVRTFLMQYSCDRATDIGTMRGHMRRSGWDGCWPEWVAASHAGNHLTKAGAQLWIRHLFSLESAAPTAGEASATQPLKLYPASEYHEDYSDVLWFAFPSFNEAPQVYCGSPLEVSPEFDDEHWTHFARVDWNDAIWQAEAMHIKATQGGREGA